MKILNSYPIIKLFGLFAIGIIAHQAIEINFSSVFIVFAIALFATLGMHFAYRFLFRKPTQAWVYSSFVMIVFALLGYGIAIKDNQPLSCNHFGSKDSEGITYIAQIVEPLQEKENTYKAVLSVEKLLINAGSTSSTGECIAYLEKDSLVKQLVYGDLILFKSKISKVEAPKNPHQFNYKKYLAAKGIHHQVYIPSKNWKHLRKAKTNALFEYSYLIRDYLVTTLRENGLQGDEFAVATALILGYDDKISYELSTKFSHAGAMHILCVSGLHVGIIYLIIFSLLTPLIKLKHGNYFRIVLVIIVIWCFAFITGLSPSVLRSATMFSFVSLGNIIKRKNSIYNTLALSAFLLLIVDSNLLFDVGFQLSYSAVVAIVAIQPGLYNAWKVKTWLLKKIWAITTVSIAAQIGTLPLALYYFNQFPNYFLLSNLLVIPLATLILYVGIAVIAFSPIKFMSMLLAKILSWLIIALNTSVSFIEGLPGSFSEGIVINKYQVLLLALIVLSIYWFFKYKNKRMFLYGIICLLVFASLDSLRRFNNSNQQSIVVYDARDATAIDFISDSKTIFYIDSVILDDEKGFNFSIRNNRWHSDIGRSITLMNDQDFYKDEELGFMKMGNFIKFNNKTIALLNPANVLIYNDSPIEVDYVLVSGNPKFSDKKVLLSYDFEKIIFDSSNKKWNVNNWIVECKELGIDYHSVPHSGAFIEDL